MISKEDLPDGHRIRRGFESNDNSCASWIASKLVYICSCELLYVWSGDGWMVKWDQGSTIVEQDKGSMHKLYKCVVATRASGER